MKINDFRYLQRGKAIGALAEQDMSLLLPFIKKGSNKNKALLVLHGFSSSPAVYRYLLPQIENYDTILCPVLPGHAESIEAFSKATAKEWLEAAKAHCEQMVSEYKQVDVLGLSLGGLLACELSQLYPIHHLFLLAPALKLHMNVNFMLKLAKILNFLGFHHIRNAAGNIHGNEHAEIAYRQLPVSTVIEMLQLAQQYQWAPPTCPVDLFLGRYDEVVASIEIESLFATVPNAKVHWLDHSAHVLPLDQDLPEIVQCINQQK